ncbi:hypothetical protein F4779DRAFT_340894 [Xylariaceae sp. FL0662B]|nr:hypothetical protein F4779DRAFT_340894 [Xylariaceae sp. FL0662B]
MPRLAARSSSGADPEAKRRKIRKGTHSCWECRRRKIRCQFSSDEATICIGCETRGSKCMSQEFPDLQPSAQDQGMEQRLSRVEGLLEKLVEWVTPDSHGPAQGGRAANPAVPMEDGPSPLALLPSAADHPPIRGILNTLREDSGTRSSTHSSFLTPPESAEIETSALPAKHAQISKTLHAAFPCQHDINSIIAASPGSYYVATIFHGYREVFEGRTEPPSSLTEVPPVTSHPALLAKRLMQLVNCMQQLLPEVSPQNLVSKEPIRTQMVGIVSIVSDLVFPNDDLVGSVEGLETMFLVGLYNANAGNLRKSWLAMRRTHAVAQLMGLDRRGDKPLKSVDPASHPSTRTKAHALWFRLNFSDRFLALLLGLSAASDDNSFAGPENTARDEPADRLEKFHTVIMGAIIKRNYNKSDSAFSATQSIDCDLELAANSMGAQWWQPVRAVDSSATLQERMQAFWDIMMKMNHHHLVVLLHLPYMMRDHKERRWDYSKTTCLNSSRELLRIFLVFRRLSDAVSACRHIDYGALTAAMTLLLGYLDPKLRSRDEQTSRQREADRILVQQVKDQMQDMADKNADKLARESSDIIGRLLPLIDVNRTARDGLDAPVRLTIPYVGTININPVNRRQDPTHTPSSGHGDGPAEPDFQGMSTIYDGDSRNTSTEPSTETPASNFLAPPEASSFSSMQFETDFPQAQQQPELAAGMDEWTLQGFDAAFFDSLLNSEAY